MPVVCSRSYAQQWGEEEEDVTEYSMVLQTNIHIAWCLLAFETETLHIGFGCRKPKTSDKGHHKQNVLFALASMDFTGINAISKIGNIFLSMEYMYGVIC